MSWAIRQADCIEAMREMDEASVDAVVCDPPYGIGFMGHEWDQPGVEGTANGKVTQYGRGHHKQRASASMVAGEYDQTRKGHVRFAEWCEAWARECFRVLKPGSHLLSFGGTRTYHALAWGVEGAGFEIRDSVIWLYGSGFPKSLDVSKAIDKAAGVEFSERPAEGVGFMNPEGEGGYNVTKNQLTREGESTPEAQRWQGWGTALKPAHEPIVVARKPLTGTVAANVTAYGTGALNVDGCRIDAGDEEIKAGLSDPANREGVVGQAWQAASDKERNQQAQRESLERANTLGRWPSNVVLSPETAEELDRQSGERKAGGNLSGSEPSRSGGEGTVAYGEFKDRREWDSYGDSGGASRFFYTAKASREERNAGLDGREAQNVNDGRATSIDNPYQRGDTLRQNVHPTVKPIDLMRWLCRLVTPPGGMILDPFNGSGTTGIAAHLESFDFIGIEREAEYVEIARARLEWWSKIPPGTEVDAALGFSGRERRIVESGQASLLEEVA